MLEIEVKDISNNTKGKISLSEVIFNNSASESVVHTAVVSYLANQRQGTHATKTRAMARGGGRKPWKQKKTGRARHGSIRSPIWKGGGVTFGPQPRDYSVKLPKTMKRVALYKALTMKLSDGEVGIVDNISMDKPKTKEIINILESMGLAGKTVLIVQSVTVAGAGNDEQAKVKNVVLSVRNIPTADVVRVSDLNAYQVVTYSYILFTKDAISMLQSRVTGGVIEANG